MLEEMEGEDARRVTLETLVQGAKDKFLYEYDFGDSWDHELLIEKVLPFEAGKRYPVCLTGKRACPPEDCGGMNRLHSGLQLRRLPFLHARNQRLVAEYLRFLTARHYSPKTIQATVGMVKSFCVLLPVAHQSRVYRDFTRTTSDDIDAWLDAAHHHGLAPSTLNNILNALHRFFAFLQE